MIKSRPKLKDVAHEAGVSIATASLVLSGKGKISSEVSDRVIASVKKLGYIKRSSSNSGKRRIKYIAVLHFEPFEYLWNFMRPCILTLEELLIQKGYFPVIFDMNKAGYTEEVLQRVILSEAGAVLSIHYGNSELFEKLEDMGIPVILINNSNFQDKFTTVCVDDFQGAYEGTRHLITLGHKNILYIEYLRTHMTSVLEDRFVGFKKAVDEFGIDFNDTMRLSVSIDEVEQLYPKLKEIFSSPEKPSAIFFHDDYVAALVMVLLRKLPIRIPQDVSIIAPGDVLDYNQSFTPKITTMSIDTSLMAQLSGDLMIKRLEADPPDIQVLKVKQQLIKRGSCKPL